MRDYAGGSDKFPYLFTVTELQVVIEKHTIRSHYKGRRKFLLHKPIPSCRYLFNHLASGQLLQVSPKDNYLPFTIKSHQCSPSSIMKLLACILSLIGISQAANFVQYSIPGIYDRSDTYTMQIDGTDVTVLKYYEYDYAHVSMTSGSTGIAVKITANETIHSSTITPQKLGIVNKVSGSTLTFSVLKDHYLVIKINALKELVLFIDPAETIVPASSGTGIYNVNSYGADNTGRTKATAAFSGAVAAAKAAGGGTVYVPAGLYLVGNIKLPSKVSLYLQGGSFLYFTGNQADYFIDAYKNSQKRNITWWISTEYDSHDVKVFGRGTVDGRSAYTVSKSAFQANLIMPINTTAFTYDGPLLRESGTWAFTSTQSTYAMIKNMKVVNQLKLFENDGIDINNCNHVTVDNAFVASGDDAYSTKTWSPTTDIATNWKGNFYSNWNITFSNTVSWSYCIGWKIGYGAVINTSGVTFKDSTLYAASVGCGIDLRYSHYGVQTYNITFENIVIENIIYGHNLGYAGWMSLVTGVSNPSGVSTIDNVLLKDVIIKDFGGKGGTLKGYNSTYQVTNVKFQNIRPPGSATAATDLAGLNVTHVSYASGVTVTS